MIRAVAWGWLFWRHRAAVRRGWNRWHRPVTTAEFAALLKTHFADHLRAALTTQSSLLWDDDQVHRDVHQQYLELEERSSYGGMIWRIPVVQSDQAASIHGR